MEIKVVIAGLLCTLVASCASVPEGLTGEQRVQVLGGMYVGKSVLNVANRYGVPQEQTEFAGQKVYLWHITNDMQWSRPVQTTTTGRVGDAWSSVPYKERTQSEQVVTSTYKCTMTVNVNADEIVTNLSVGGQAGACKLFDP